MKYIEKPRFEIFEGYGISNELIKKASTTCYRSEQTSTKSAYDFVQMLKNNNHYACLEFCWYVIHIVPKASSESEIKDLFYHFNGFKYLNASIESNTIIVSGNARAWYEYVQQELQSQNDVKVVNSITHLFQDLNPVLFDFNVNQSEDYVCRLIPENQVWSFQEKDRNKHDWICAKFFDVSRSLSHELVRHRVFSFAMESSRYVANKDFRMIIDNEAIQSSTDKQKIDDCMKMVQETYNYLLNRGLKRDCIRNILPIGLGCDIVVAGNFNAWQHYFDLRTNSKAHREIRELSIELKDQLNKKGYRFN
jgi:thymidylate synthase ThyX